MELKLCVYTIGYRAYKSEGGSVSFNPVYDEHVCDWIFRHGLKQECWTWWQALMGAIICMRIICTHEANQNH